MEDKALLSDAHPQPDSSYVGAKTNRIFRAFYEKENTKDSNLKNRYKHRYLFRKLINTINIQNPKDNFIFLVINCLYYMYIIYMYNIFKLHFFTNYFLIAS